MVPDDWNKFTVTRPYRGASYQFNFRRATGGEETGISVDGVKIDSNRVFPHHDGAVHQVEVIF
jgi:cellobiose phosphorylase